MSERITIDVQSTRYNASKLPNYIEIIGSDGYLYTVAVFPEWIKLQISDQITLRLSSKNGEAKTHEMIEVHGRFLNRKEEEITSGRLRFLGLLFSIPSLSHLALALKQVFPRKAGDSQVRPGIEDILNFED